MSEIELTPAMHQVLEELSVQQDELDSRDFNPIDFINKEFPDEQSLVNIDPILTKLKIRISQFDSEISTEVRQLSRAGDKASEDLDGAQKSILHLFEKIHQIKEKADKSEKMVQEICSGIKSLDHAKRNITATITGLNRIHMLVTKVDQLQEWTEKRQYQDVRTVIEAVNQLYTLFAKEEKYTKIPRIVNLINSVEQIKETLETKVHYEFFNQQEKPNHAQLADVCHVIDALGPAAREKFKSEFCSNQMDEYQKIFKPSEESFRLEYCERRFSWCRRKLRDCEQLYADVFPSSWRMAEQLAELFAQRTRSHFSIMLEKESVPDVKILLLTIRETLKWEKEMCTYFAKQPAVSEHGSPLVGSESSGFQSEEPEEVEEEGDDHPQSAAAIARRYRKFQQEREKAQNLNKPQMQLALKFKGIISNVFDNYMNIYVNEEDSLMKEKFDKVLTDESWEIDDKASNKVLQSSTELIFYFKKTMKRCTELTTNKAFYDMFQLYKKYLHNYAQMLSKKLPIISSSNRVDLTERDERTTCLIINTGAYISLLCDQLVSNVKSIIDKEFIPNIEMKKEQQEFSGVVAKAFQVLVTGLLTKTSESLQMLIKTPWGSWNSVVVEDQSDYVNQFSSYILQTVPLYNDWLSPTHSKYFCDSFVGAFVPELIGHIYKCKHISEQGAQQLLLDVAGMKGVLVQMPALTNKKGVPSQTVNPRYANYVTKEMAKAEKVLKVLLCPTEMVGVNFANVLPRGSEQLLVKLLDIKNVSKGEQVHCIQAFRKEKQEQQQKQKKK